MKLHRLPQFDRDYLKLPAEIKTKLHFFSAALAPTTKLSKILNG